jgi:Cu/Ag efflux pump CusA
LTVQTFLGGVNVNEFSRFGRNFKVSLQAEPEFRADIKSLGLMYVRNQKGEMVPLSTLIVPSPISAPTVIQRYNPVLAIRRENGRWHIVQEHLSDTPESTAPGLASEVPVAMPAPSHQH